MTSRISALGLVRIGLALEALGLAAVGFIARPDTAWWILALALFVYGIGIGFATAQVTNVVLSDVPERSSGQGSGMQSVFRQLGSALGIAVLTTAFFSVISSQLSRTLADSGVPPDQSDSVARTVVRSAGAAIDEFARQPQTAGIADAARQAMAHGVELGSYLAAAFLVVGLAATFLISPATTAEPAPLP